MSVLVQLPNPTQNPSKDAKMDFCSFIFSIFCFMWILFPQRIVGEDLYTDQLALLMFKISYCPTCLRVCTTHTRILLHIL